MEKKLSAAEKVSRKVSLYDAIKDFEHYCRVCSYYQFCGFAAGLTDLAERYHTELGIKPFVNQLSRTIAFHCKKYTEKDN